MRTILMSVLAITVMASIGCGGDDDASGGTGGTAGTAGTAGAGGFVTEVCTGATTDDPNCINEDCPNVSPVTGPRAMKGKCCFRRSNYDRAKAAWDADQLATIEFRQNALVTFSQPSTVGLALIQAALADSYAEDLSNTLVRIAGIPKEGSAAVTVTIGAGRSNCDGTYSFFGDGGAPDHENRTDANRWSAVSMQATWDWDAAQKLTIPDSVRPTDTRWAPVARTVGEFGYEQPSRNLNYDIQIDADDSDSITPNELNCLGGELASSGIWQASLMQTVFFRVDDLIAAGINSTTVVQNFCSFMALGYMVPEMCPDVPQDEWIEKPFGMCNDDQLCYVGDENHPDADCGATDKPCCDPSGVDTDKPACNAFYITARSVLAGAEITTAPATNASAPFTDCTL